MDFFIRKKIFIFSLIFLAIFLITVLMSFYFFSPGFFVSSNLDLEQDNPILNINIRNDSFHIIQNIRIVINDENIYREFNLIPKDENRIELIVSEEELFVEVYADNHLKYEKMYTLKGAISKNSLDFYPEYIFKGINELSDFNLEICNKESLIEVFVEIETDAEIKQGYAKQDVILEKEECKILNYKLLYLIPGNKRVKFKIYNDIYSKELSINGIVS